MITLQRIEDALRQYRPKFSLGQRFETNARSNFLNFVKKIDGENGSVYVMKVPKRFTDVICYLRITVFNFLGDKGVLYASFPERMKNEKEKIKLLNEKGVPSIPLANADAEGALVTKFIRGTNLKDIFQDSNISFEKKLKILAKSCERLENIHAYFSHGDAQIRNVFITEDNETIWLDYEYIVNSDIPLLRQKARDLIILIFSATKHLGNPDEVVTTILNSYKEDEVKRIIQSLFPYQSIAYNLFLNFLNPFLCIKTRKVLRDIEKSKI